MYTKEELQSGLNTDTFARKLYVYNSIDSTNACAKVLANAGAEEGTVVIAEFQTAGRGRQGRTWQSESGRNLLFSFIIRPKLDINKVGLLTFFAASSVSLAIESLSDIRCECKWPNDILLNGKKCCGILMESAFQHNMLDYAVVGIGLNVNQRVFANDLDKKATSLSLECKKEFDRKVIFQQVMRSLETNYIDVSSGNFDNVLKEWKARTTIFGKQITLIQGDDKLQGCATGITTDGGLLIATPEGERVFYTGDISLQDNFQS
jgi:BirA family biotin operon repressor/biotin-[acetyl-CoA-carboxylase] ligase